MNRVLGTKKEVRDFNKEYGTDCKLGDTIREPEIPKLFAPQKQTADFRQVGGDHYTSNSVQPWDAMQSWMSPEQFEGFLRGNVIRYIARYDKKNGLEDVKKAQHYIDKLVETMEAE